MALLAVCLTHRASAQPAEPSPVDEPSVRFYVTSTFGVAIVDVHSDNGVPEYHSGDAIAILAGSAGIEVDAPRRVSVRVGPSVALFARASDDLGLGGELQLDVPLNPCWRIGARASASYLVFSERGAFTVGMRVRHRHVLFGFDVLRTTTAENAPAATGVVFTVGFEGRPARYVTGISLGLVVALGPLVYLFITSLPTNQQ